MPPAGIQARSLLDSAATWHVLGTAGTIGDDWHAQWELIVEGATLLDSTQLWSRSL